MVKTTWTNTVLNDFALPIIPKETSGYLRLCFSSCCSYKEKGEQKRTWEREEEGILYYPTIKKS